jgi:hypothetical protein
MKNTKRNKISETLNEFLADGAPYQLSQEGDGFTNHWSFEVHFEGATLTALQGGVDSTMPNVRTAVITLLVKSGAMSPKGDEVGWERFILYSKDWKTDEEAEDDLNKKKTEFKWIQK